MIVANAVNLLPFYFIRLTIDGLTGATDADGGTAGVTLAQVGLYAAGVVLAALAAGALMLVMRRQIVVASRQTEYEIRRDIYANLQTLDKNYYDRLGWSCLPQTIFRIINGRLFDKSYPYRMIDADTALALARACEREALRDQKGVRWPHAKQHERVAVHAVFEALPA